MLYRAAIPGGPIYALISARSMKAASIASVMLEVANTRTLGKPRNASNCEPHAPHDTFHETSQKSLDIMTIKTAVVARLVCHQYNPPAIMAYDSCSTTRTHWSTKQGQPREDSSPGSTMKGGACMCEEGIDGADGISWLRASHSGFACRCQGLHFINQHKHQAVLFLNLPPHHLIVKGDTWHVQGLSLRGQALWTHRGPLSK